MPFPKNNQQKQQKNRKDFETPEVLTPHYFSGFSKDVCFFNRFFFWWLFLYRHQGSQARSFGACNKVVKLITWISQLSFSRTHMGFQPLGFCWKSPSFLWGLKNPSKIDVIYRFFWKDKNREKAHVCFCKVFSPAFFDVAGGFVFWLWFLMTDDPLRFQVKQQHANKNPEKSNALTQSSPPRYPRFPNKTSKATTFSNFKTQFSFCQVLQVERSKIFTSLSIRLSIEFHKFHVFENNKSL